jgi:cardiolipin synthase A/B
MSDRPLMLIIWSVLHVLIFLTITFHCLERQRHPSSTLLWIFVAWSFPILGPLFYLFFGIDRVADRGFLKFIADERLLNTRKDTKIIAPRAYWHHTLSVPDSSEFDWVLDTLIPDHPAHAGNQIRPLITGDEAYPEMLAAIRGAKDHIHLQSFIIGNDATTHEFMDALEAKAAEGVKVRLLYDRFGSTQAHVLGLFRKYKKIKNFQIAGWTQANPLKRQFQINLRNHRKVLIVDGKTGFFGGINLHQKNTSAENTAPIRDYHFVAEGFIVQELQYSFLRDWYFITNENPALLLTEKYFPDIEENGDVTARLINSGPSSGKDVAIETFFNGITLAKKQVLAVTPYFVPPVEILRALRSAALRGVDVSIVVPQKNNHRCAELAGRSYYEELLNAGVHIYERRPPFMHAKAMIIDGKLSLVGTSNLDHRSLNLNYESTVAIYSSTFADAMKGIIHEDLVFSDEIILTAWNNRSSTCKLFENLAALMAPIL